MFHFEISSNMRSAPFFDCLETIILLRTKHPSAVCWIWVTLHVRIWCKL